MSATKTDTERYFHQRSQEVIQNASFYVWSGDAQVEFNASSFPPRTGDQPRSVFACGVLLTPLLVKDLSHFRRFRTQQNRDTIKTFKNDQAGNINIY